MTEALDRLIEAVGAGTADAPESRGSHGLWLFFAAFPPGDSESHALALAAYRGSLDAARALHEALLGKDCHFNLMEDEDAGGYQAEVYLSGWHYAGSSCPARAWLLAILKAHRAQIGADG